jgi:hypothetical protein
MSATSPTNGTHSDPIPASAKPQAAEGGRDAHGRFASGNGGGPGNPFARQVAALRKALLASVTDADMEAIMRELLRQAKEGNLAAARLLLSYTLGKPAPAVDPDTLDFHEWELYQRLPDPAPEMAAAPQRMALPVALKYMRAVLPPIAESQQRMLAEEAQAGEAAEQREAAAREERRQRRQERKAQQAAAPQSPPPSAPRPPSVDEKALALLARLLDLGTPSANGDFRRPEGPRPPSANGRTHPDGGGNSR